MSYKPYYEEDRIKALKKAKTMKQIDFINKEYIKLLNNIKRINK